MKGTRLTFTIHCEPVFNPDPTYGGKRMFTVSSQDAAPVNLDQEWLWRILEDKMDDMSIFVLEDIRLNQLG